MYGMVACQIVKAWWIIFLSFRIPVDYWDTRGLKKYRFFFVMYVVQRLRIKEASIKFLHLSLKIIVQFAVQMT